MVTATLFNGKGGVGKTTMTMMFASWLNYGLGKQVFVYDLENPIPRIAKYRGRELAMAKYPDSWIAKYLATHPGHPLMYTIGILGITPEYSDNYLAATLDSVWETVEKIEKDFDYFFVDFPAVMMKNSPSYALITSGLFDFVGIPMTADTDSFTEGMRVLKTAQGYAKDVVFFWNRLTRDEVMSSTIFRNREETIRRAGSIVLPQRVRTFAKANRDSDATLFVKSTLCWPQRNVELYSPSVLPLFEELKSRMDAIASLNP